MNLSLKTLWRIYSKKWDQTKNWFKSHKLKHYYILPSKEELKKLNMEGKLMPLNPDMKILDDHLKTFDDTYKIKELVEKNKKQIVPKTEVSVFFKEKEWLFTYKGYQKIRNGEAWNKLEIRCPNDGFRYTQRPTVEKVAQHHNSFNFSSLDKLDSLSEIPFITKLSKDLQADIRFLFNIQERRMDIIFRVENRRLLEISFEPGYPIEAEDKAKAYFKYYNENIYNIELDCKTNC
eukprot:TRINITY_DN373_c1_g1_i1.p1 TRINITY_DN373_c1_g1~~TRINITY_DN373_c1_g1_i1.p1  ORF type:complete len:234 (-),score=43.86 TRINITY_DN373_c1_g1_i1:307-1008(-)